MHIEFERVHVVHEIERRQKTGCAGGDLYAAFEMLFGVELPNVHYSPLFLGFTVLLFQTFVVLHMINKNQVTFSVYT